MKKILSENKWLVGILIASVLARVIAAILFGDQVVDMPGTFDQISYHNLALRVLGGNGFSFATPWWPITPAGAPTAHWSFLYTFYLVFVYSIFGPHPLAARLLQAIITGILQPYLAYKIGSSIFSKSVGLISAAATAIYIYFIYYDATLMTEPFFIVLVMLGVYLSIQMVKSKDDFTEKRNLKFLKLPILLGLTLGAAVLLRELIIILIPIIYVWVGWVKGKSAIKRTLLSFLVSSLMIVIMILPFSIYNTGRFHHFVLLNTNSGYAFFWANHPIYGTHFLSILPTETYQSLIPVELRNLDEAALDQALLQRGVQFIFNDPGRYILLSISRIPVYFEFWPSSDSGLVSNLSRVFSFGIFLPFMLYGMYRSFANKRISFVNQLKSPSFLLILFGVIYSAIHLLSWSLIRYRLPVDALGLVFAGYAILDLTQRVMARRKLSAKPTT